MLTTWHFKRLTPNMLTTGAPPNILIRANIYNNNPTRYIVLVVSCFVLPIPNIYRNTSVLIPSLMPDRRCRYMTDGASDWQTAPLPDGGCLYLTEGASTSIHPECHEQFLWFLVLVFFGVFLPAVDQLSVPPRKRICNTKKIEGDNITGRLRAVWAKI